MTRAELMAKAEAELDAAIEAAAERSRRSFVDGGIEPEIYEPILEADRERMVELRAERLAELRRFIEHGDMNMPTMAVN